MEMNLRNIYKVKDEYYYDIVTYDESLLNITHDILSLNGLEQRLKRIGDIKCDFSIEDGILKCNSMLEPYSIDESFLHSVLRNVEEENRNNTPSNNSIYGLLSAGVQHDYLILDNKCDNWEHNYGVAKFSSIQFSNMTMSIYVRMISEEGIYNKMIVTLKDGVLQFSPFYVATRQGVGNIPGCVDLNKTININNVEYKLWETNILQVYDAVLFSEGLVNQSCCESTIYNVALSVCKDYIGQLTDYMGKEHESVWVGGENDYKSMYGVFFKSSCPSLSKRLQELLEKKALEAITAGHSKEEVSEIVRKELAYHSADTSTSRFALFVFTTIAMHPGNVYEKLKFAFEMKEILKKHKFWLDMYMYRVRASAFFLKKKLTSYNRPVLTGGTTMEYTNVRAIFD